MQGKNVLDDVIYRCINEGCARSYPRPVAYCPFCGTRQAGAPAEKIAAPEKSLAAPAPGSSPMPALASLAAPPVARRRQFDFGRRAAPAQPVPPAPPPTAPGPRPVRKRTWLVVLLALWAIWLFARPGNEGKKIDARLNAAIALSSECNLEDARTELAALKKTAATPAQLKRLQKAITDMAPQCASSRWGANAWSDTKAALDTALQTTSFDQALSRLTQLIRRWAEEPDPRAPSERAEGKRGARLLDEADACAAKSDRACLQQRLQAAERLKRPELRERVAALHESLAYLLKATPPKAAPQVRTLLADAERALQQGDYQGAVAKMDACAAVDDSDHKECAALKQKAERLNSDMSRCLASGADWISDRCQ